MIHDGGSEKDSTHFNGQDNVFTGSTLPPTTLSTGNQLFISYKNNANELNKGFSVSFVFGKKVTNFNIILLV